MEVQCKYSRCPYCYKVERGSEDHVKYNNKNYHKSCGQLQKEKDELVAYLCFIFGLKAPGPTITRQINTFIDKYHYTYTGMKQALQYFYEVKHNKDKNDIDNKSIGIIPYIYGEAQEYFNNLEIKKERLRRQGKNISEDNVVIVKMQDKQIKRPRYNLEDIQ